MNDSVEQMTAPERPAIALNHLGFRLRTGGKVLLVKALPSALAAPREFTLRDVVPTFHFSRPLTESRSDLGPCLTGDFSDLDRPGLYQITVGDEYSVQFAIRDDVWRRTLPKAVGYYRKPAKAWVRGLRGGNPISQPSPAALIYYLPSAGARAPATCPHALQNSSADG